MSTSGFRVVMRQDVGPDFPGRWNGLDPGSVVLRAGESYAAEVGDYGAVAARAPLDGAPLIGVKPGEFDFVEVPFVGRDGSRTVLDVNTWRVFGPHGGRARLERQTTKIPERYLWWWVDETPAEPDYTYRLKP